MPNPASGVRHPIASDGHAAADVQHTGANCHAAKDVGGPVTIIAHASSDMPSPGANGGDDGDQQHDLAHAA